MRIKKTVSQEELEALGYQRTDNSDIMYIKRTSIGNVFIDYTREVLTFHSELVQDLVDNNYIDN